MPKAPEPPRAPTADEMLDSVLVSIDGAPHPIIADVALPRV